MEGIRSEAVSWEAMYKDGTSIRENLGAVYKDIDRSRLASFRLLAPGEIIAEQFCGNGREGFNFAYRRRTVMNATRGSLGRTVWFVMGFVPQGPVIAIQPETLQYMEDAYFHPGAGPLGQIMPVVEEGELWTNEMHSHKTDGTLRNERIVLPSGYTMNHPSSAS